MPERTVTLCLAQIPVIKGNIERNLELHLTAIESAQQADVVVFPELSLTGYELPLLADLALNEESLAVEALSNAARKYQITIVAGCPWQVEGKEPTIAAVICFPNGQVDVYHKQFLHSGEERYCSAGNTDYVLLVNGFRLGLAVCADFIHPAHYKQAKASGIDAYLVSALISPTGYSADEEILLNIAKAAQVPVLLSNHCAPTGGWQTAGKSAVCSPKGEGIYAPGVEVGLFKVELSAETADGEFQPIVL